MSWRRRAVLHLFQMAPKAAAHTLGGTVVAKWRSRAKQRAAWRRSRRPKRCKFSRTRPTASYAAPATVDKRWVTECWKLRRTFPVTWRSHGRGASAARANSMPPGVHSPRKLTESKVATIWCGMAWSNQLVQAPRRATCVEEATVRQRRTERRRTRSLGLLRRRKRSLGHHAAWQCNR